MSDRKKVLIIDDDMWVCKTYRTKLASHVEIVEARTLDNAFTAWDLHPDVDLIIMDGCLHGETPDTIALIRKIRETYIGPIIAASSDSYFRDQLMTAGCSHNANGSKSDVPKLVLGILDIQ